MGAYLSQPITDKESTDGEDAKFKYGTTAMQGWRTNMEVRDGTLGTGRQPRARKSIIRVRFARAPILLPPLPSL